MSKFNIKNLGKSAVSTMEAGAGGVASVLLDKVIPASISPTIKGLGKIAIAAIAPEFAPKNSLVNNASKGFAGAASADLFKTLMPSMAGVGEIDLTNENDYVEGIGEEYVTEYVEGVEDEDQIEGVESPISGDSPISGVDDVAVQ